MEVYEVCGSGNRWLEVVDVGVYFGSTALIGLAIFVSTLLICWSLKSFDWAGFILLAGVGGSILYPLLWLITCAETRWRPVSEASYKASLSAEEEKAALSFWRRYVSDDGTVPQGPVAGRRVRAQVQVTRVDYLVRFHKKEATASPHLIRVEAKDGKGRRWVFFTRYETFKRNPVVSDKLLIGLKLTSETFQNGYVSISAFDWEA